jgi:FKBP-type peptidyl-prolyl cis-trans isomerase SlyD
MQIASDRVVSFGYTLRDEEGTLIDESGEGHPATYLHGHGGLIPGVERALEGKAVGDSIQCTVPPEEGYGPYIPDLDLAVPVDRFSEEDRARLAPGVQFQGPHPEKEGESLVYTVHEVGSEDIKVSANHPLAGRTLSFDLTVVAVRAATEEELANGHVHGPEGQQA